MSSSSVNSSPADGFDTAIGMESSTHGRLLSKKIPDKCSSTYISHNRLSRYTTALANLVPVRFNRVPGSEIPIDKIGLFSSVSLSWLNEYISAGWNNGMRDKPIPIITIQESCQVNGPRIDGLWHSHIVKKGQAGASVPGIVWHFVQTRALVASLIYFLGMMIALCSPILVLQKIIYTIEDRVNVTSNHNNTNNTINIIFNSTNITENKTIKYINGSYKNNELMDIMIIDDVIIFTHITILIIAEILSYFLIAWSSTLNLVTATRLRTACLALAYKKLIKSSIKYDAPVYETLTYFIPDSRTLYELIANGPQIFSGPLIILFSSLFIWYSMGHWALIGIGVLITLYLGMILGCYLTNIFATRIMKCSLKRLYLFEEFIASIYSAKIAQWDNHFVGLIRSIRKKELDEMKFMTMNEGRNLCMIHIIPIVTISAITMAYLLTHKHIISASYITCLILILSNVKYCARGSYHAMSNISRGIAILNNLKIVLTLNGPVRYTEKPIDKNLAIAINNGEFSWDVGQSLHLSKMGSLSHVDNQISPSISIHKLHDINFYAPKGGLIGICGGPGTGKTSLLLSIMGQLNYINGHVTIDGTMSYVPDNISLFDGTVKENIVMEEIFDSTWYYKTINACYLNDEITQLPSSDDTHISISNLSIIQKQKIALARAIYSNRAINLMDNPLKDADTHDTMRIFKKAIIEIMREHTVIVVTDKINILRKCDTIYMMNEGRIIVQGKHEDLININNDYANLIKYYENNEHQSTEELLPDLTTVQGSGNSNISECIIDTLNNNDKESDVIVNDNNNYWSEFVSVISIIYSIPIAVTPLIFFYIIQKILIDKMHIAIILASVVAYVIIIGVILTTIYNKDVYNTAKNIHEKWLQKIYRAHISVFTIVSSSILINIFSLHMQQVDYTLPKLKITALIYIGISIFSAITLAILSLWFIIPTIIFIIIVLFYNYYVKNFIMILNEMCTESIIPIYNHATNAINGRVTIQVYGKEREFTKKFYKHCNANVTYDFMFEACKLWIDYRIKLLSAFTLAATMIICGTVSDLKNQYDIVGLAFLFTLQMTMSVNQLIGILIDAIRSLLIVNIADNYIQDIPQEIDVDQDYRREWPLIPSVHIQNVLFTRHSTNNEPLNFSIYAGESVAIHGSDPVIKRDLVKALLQFQEVFSGNILVGSMNIADIHVDILRRHINYIPSVPILFNGSIRYNLEPKNRKTNNEIRNVLEKVFLWNKISKLNDELQTDINNVYFSITEKKLLSLARIYLNTNCVSRNIIILENVGPDYEIIDSLLQDMFKQFTIIVLSNETNWNYQRVIRLPDKKEIGIIKKQKIT